MVRRQSYAVLLAAVVAIVFAQAGSSARGQEGGILRINLSPGMGVTDLDPALSYSPAGWSLLDATCARLYTYPDARAPRSFRPRPEVAAGYSGSKDLKTYTFTLRRGFRLNTGERVRASAFEHATNRVLHPVVKSSGALPQAASTGLLTARRIRRNEREFPLGKPGPPRGQTVRCRGYHPNVCSVLPAREPSWRPPVPTGRHGRLPLDCRAHGRRWGDTRGKR